MVGIPNSLFPADEFNNNPNNPDNNGNENYYLEQKQQQQRQNPLKSLLTKYDCQLKVDEEPDVYEEDEESLGWGLVWGYSFTVKHGVKNIKMLK
jgi:hypothetical protein